MQKNNEYGGLLIDVPKLMNEVKLRAPVCKNQTYRGKVIKFDFLSYFQVR